MRRQAFIVSILLVTIFSSSCNQTPEAKEPANHSPKLDEAAETAAIWKTIEGETKCFFDGDYDCWAKHWSHDPNIYQAWNNDDGTADVAIGWDKISTRAKGWIEKYYKNGTNIIHPVVKREKPFVKFFNDSTAYLHWKQYNADKEKTTFRASQELRIMSKEAGAWKIVNVSAFWDTERKIPFDSLKLQ